MSKNYQAAFARCCLGAKGKHTETPRHVRTGKVFGIAGKWFAMERN